MNLRFILKPAIGIGIDTEASHQTACSANIKREANQPVSHQCFCQFHNIKDQVHNMTESEFNDSIDCAFPYQNPLKWKRAVAVGARISPNAAFIIASELCHPPRGHNTQPGHRMRIWHHLAKRFRHPLKAKLSKLIEQQIRGEPVTVAAAIKAMRLVSQYPGQYAALSICYTSCDDRDGKVDALDEQIRQEWECA